MLCIVDLHKKWFWDQRSTVVSHSGFYDCECAIAWGTTNAHFLMFSTSPPNYQHEKLILSNFRDINHQISTSDSWSPLGHSSGYGRHEAAVSYMQAHYLGHDQSLWKRFAHDGSLCGLTLDMIHRWKLGSLMMAAWSGSPWKWSRSGNVMAWVSELALDMWI